MKKNRTNNTDGKPEWIIEAESRMPEYILPSDKEKWVNLFRSESHILNTEDWATVAQKCEQIWAERQYPCYMM